MESREKKRKTGGETQKRGENEREGVEKRGKGLSSGTRRWARDVWQAGEQRGLLSCRRGGRKRACAFDPPCGPHHRAPPSAPPLFLWRQAPKILAAGSTWAPWCGPQAGVKRARAFASGGVTAPGRTVQGALWGDHSTSNGIPITT